MSSQTLARAEKEESPAASGPLSLSREGSALSGSETEEVFKACLQRGLT
jgi:hypothetical protein